MIIRRTAERQPTAFLTVVSKTISAWFNYKDLSVTSCRCLSAPSGHAGTKKCCPDLNHATIPFLIKLAAPRVQGSIDIVGDPDVTRAEPYDVVVGPRAEWLFVAMQNGGSDGSAVIVDLATGMLLIPTAMAI